MSRLLKTCLVVAILAAGLAFHLRNDQFVTLDYYSGGIDLPFSLWLFVALTIGAVLGIAAALPIVLRYRRESARQARQLRLYETELNGLRTQPVKDVSGWTPPG